MRGRLTHAVGWNTVGTVFNQGSTFVVNIVLAHLLAQRAFGQYAMIHTTVAVLVAMAQLASGYTATKYLAEYRDSDPRRAGRILALCALVSLTMAVVASTALMLGADIVASIGLSDPDLAKGLMIAAVVVFFAALSGFLTGALAGFEDFPAIGKAGVISGLLYVLLSAAGGALGGVNGALVGVALSAFIQFGILWTLFNRERVRRGIVTSWSGAKQEIGVVLHFYLPAALTGLVALPAIWIANAVLVRQSQGYEELALFTAANSFRTIVLFIPNILNTVGMSMLNNQRGAGDETRFRRLFWTNLAITAAVVVLGAGVVAIAGRLLLSLFGGEFVAAYPILLILMAAALAEGLALAVFQSIQSHGYIWTSLFCVVVPSYGALVLAAGLLVPSAGASGLAWAYFACWTISLAADSVIVWRLGVWSAPRVLYR